MNSDSAAIIGSKTVQREAARRDASVRSSLQRLSRHRRGITFRASGAKFPKEWRHGEVYSKIECNQDVPDSTFVTLAATGTRRSLSACAAPRESAQGAERP